ncbi:DUF2252 domain-containing protein [Aquihabitans sp. McL0605]|uniref:DUF2252 domain-containing protein n=1 Tax=Aquihabitans sp. McL0605 TaxID=3415671 RepID=UPI003CE69587
MSTTSNDLPLIGAPHASVEERTAAGRAARQAVPRSTLAVWDPSLRTHDPIELLKQQAATRVPELVPIRHGRMSASPFTNYRGAALMMAADLAATPHTGLDVQLCGDAHLSNFGGFASPERKLVFDLNDFDETLPGPFEWDMKRLVASLDVAARDRGIAAPDRSHIVVEAARAYREAMYGFAEMRDLEVWYSSESVEEAFDEIRSQALPRAVKQTEKFLAKAHTKDQMRAAGKLTREVDGRLEFIHDPPLLVPVSDLVGHGEAAQYIGTIRDSLDLYHESLNDDRRHLLRNYEFQDLARKVVGVGSVGTRAWVVLFVGRDLGDPLILQVKEAQGSVLEGFLPRSRYATHGERVVQGQRLTQASSDILLGWMQAVGIDGTQRDFFVRQLWDWKASVPIEAMMAPGLAVYGRMCARTLARAHARSGDRIAIASYLGPGTVFDRSMSTFAAAYADQNDRDHAELMAAIADGRIEAEVGI